jgi:hypothetical protein
MSDYPPMPPMHSTPTPKSYEWVWFAAFIVVFVAVVVAIGVIGPSRFFPSDPAAPSPSVSGSP